MDVLTLALSPSGRVYSDPAPTPELGVTGALAKRIAAAFERGSGHGLLHLGTSEVATHLPGSLGFFRDLAALLVTRLCKLPDLDALRTRPELLPPETELARHADTAPPFLGAENATPDLLARLWEQTLDALGEELAASGESVQHYLHSRSPLWQLVGRVHFHLAERKDDARAPFAFLATYTTRVGANKKAQHRPLGQALAESAEARDKSALLALLQPVQRAAERNPFVQGMLDDGTMFRPTAWTAEQAYRLLRAIPECEAAGVVVLVPDWWRARAPRPRVQVRLGTSAPAGLGLDAIVDFEIGLALGEHELTRAETESLLAGPDGLVRLRGQWVEVDRARLEQALEHWQRVEEQAGTTGLTFAESMRLLAGAPLEPAVDVGAMDPAPDWSEIHAGPWLRDALAELRDPRRLGPKELGDELRATLRPYQEAGAGWLLDLGRLGLGACLADDMGLGKTLQVIALLLLRRKQAAGRAAAPSLVVAPASLLANWLAELARFAPSLLAFVAHSSAVPADELSALDAKALRGTDVVLTTYGTVLRLPWLSEIGWQAVVLDEAQAIKNPDAKQTRAVKKLRGGPRIALTGTPIENRLGDLWSLFDFLNPGLLGAAAQFKRFVKALEKREPPDFGPLRRLVAPYILRRMKTDRRVIADLPDKTEVDAWCGLTRAQAALYQRSVDELRKALATATPGVDRRGKVLAFLLRLKQICNHPSQWLGDQDWSPEASGKFARLRELGEEIASRQEKALVFTQFQEITEPLAAYLGTVFGRAGLVLHGGTPLPERRKRVERFQGDDAVPFFVISVKAGGTGLNLTAASHVVHFDRWWNPAVEDQATDRAFRIGQKKNVLVHKLVCRGTVEEKIAALIADKRQLAGEILGGDGGKFLTELGDRELLDFVAMDVARATAEL